MILDSIHIGDNDLLIVAEKNVNCAQTKILDVVNIECNSAYSFKFLFIYLFRISPIFDLTLSLLWDAIVALDYIFSLHFKNVKIKAFPDLAGTFLNDCIVFFLKGTNFRGN